MPAYAVVIVPKTCERPRCTRRARYTVHNGRNAPVGVYCAPCAKATVADLDAGRPVPGR